MRAGAARCAADHPAWGRCRLSFGHARGRRSHPWAPHCAAIEQQGRPVYQRWEDEGVDWPELPERAHQALPWAAERTAIRRGARGL